MSTRRSFIDKLCIFVATGFGIGLVVPFAPGTFGSAAGVALAYATSRLELWLQIVAALGFALAAIPFCGAAERILGVKDDGRIVADEWMLFPVAVIGIPVSSLPWWNMAAQNQATDRAHHIGQTKKVTVYRLILKDTIEEKILNLQQIKKDLADAILEGEQQSLMTMTADELLDLLS